MAATTTKIETHKESEALAPIDEREAALEIREKLFHDKEQILKDQSEHYEKVLMELRDKFGNLTKENKKLSSERVAECAAKLKGQEIELGTKLKKQEGELKLKASKHEAELQEKWNRKEAEIKKSMAKMDSELKVALGDLKNLKDSRADAFRSIYEKMEPKKAAKIMNEMDLDLVHKILASIKQDSAAEILSLMTAEKAKIVTEKAYPVRNTASLK